MHIVPSPQGVRLAEPQLVALMSTVVPAGLAVGLIGSLARPAVTIRHMM
jgi:hypothetical protein